MTARSETAVSGDDTAGSDDHNRRVEPAIVKPLYRDHAEEIVAMRDGSHPALKTKTPGRRVMLVL